MGLFQGKTDVSDQKTRATGVSVDTNRGAKTGQSQTHYR